MATIHTYEEFCAADDTSVLLDATGEEFWTKVAVSSKKSGYRYTKIPEAIHQEIQVNSGILLTAFNPETGAFDRKDIIAATTGGIEFESNPLYNDLSDSFDNLLEGTSDMRRLYKWEAEISGTFITINAEAVQKMLGAADVSGNKISPRSTLKKEDFFDLWWVGDYSDKTGETGGGYLAIHMINVISTGGFSVQSVDRGKGTFAFSFSANYSLENQGKPPFEVYIRKGTG